MDNPVHIAGTTLGFTVEGSGTPLLVAGSSIYYPGTFSHRLKQSCKIVCADLPHFVRPGPDLKIDSISFDLYAECVEDVRVAAGLGRVVIAGHSHHGNVALEYAKRYPGNVSHVVLIGTPPVDIARTIEGARRYWDTHASDERKRLLQDRRRALSEEYLRSLSSKDAFVARYVADAPLYWYDGSYDAAWLWRGMDFDVEVVGAFRDLYRDYELDWDPSVMEPPVLVVMGRYDYTVAHTLWEDKLPKLRNVTFEVLERSGHTPQLEEAGVFEGVLLGWLKH